MAAAMSTAIGPILGGVLTDTIGWRYIFWLNVPVGVLALLMTRLYLPESRDHEATQIDIRGQTLAMLGLGALTIVLVEGRDDACRLGSPCWPSSPSRESRRSWPASVALPSRCCRWTCSAAAD